MPKFVIERQYLVPMYQHIVVVAETLEEACTKAISDDIDWDTREMDCGRARATTITEAKVIPERYDVDHFERVLIASRDPKGLPLDTPRFITISKLLATLSFKNYEHQLDLADVGRKAGASTHAAILAPADRRR
jgi:hypothetical protein